MALAFGDGPANISAADTHDATRIPHIHLTSTPLVQVSAWIGSGEETCPRFLQRIEVSKG